jgi:hypothetical protein
VVGGRPVAPADLHSESAHVMHCPDSHRQESLAVRSRAKATRLKKLGGIMKKLKLIGLMLMAVFALGAFAAATASAEEGFLPKQATGLALGGESALETMGGQKIVCKTLDTGEIKFSTDKTGEGTLHWLGCKAEGLFALNSLGDKTEEILALVKFLVCLDPTNITIKEGKEVKTLLDAMGIAGEVVGKLHLEIPVAGILTIVTGTALGAILTTGKATLWSMEFLGGAAGAGKEKGVQTVTECKQGTTVIRHSLLSEENEHKNPVGASEAVAGGLLQFKESVELEDA